MVAEDRYRLTFAHALDAGTDEVVVHRTDAKGPGGNPVYCDDSGILRAEISPRGEVRMLASGGHQSPRRPTATHLA